MGERTRGCHDYGRDGSLCLERTVYLAGVTSCIVGALVESIYRKLKVHGKARLGEFVF